jgi:hypothetical protein
MAFNIAERCPGFVSSSNIAGVERPLVAWLSYKSYPSYGIPEQVDISFAPFKVQLIEVSAPQPVDCLRQVLQLDVPAPPLLLCLLV